MFFLLYGDYILNISDFIEFQSSQVQQTENILLRVFFFVFSFSSFSVNSLTSSSLMDANLLAMLLF